NVYRYSYTNTTFDTGTVTVTFKAGGWQDSLVQNGATLHNASATSTQSFKIVSQAPVFFISISGGIELRLGDFLSEPLMSVEAEAELDIDAVRKVFTLSFDGQLSIIKLGTVGSTSGRFILDTSGSDNTPKFWGVATLQTNFQVLEQYGLFFNVKGTLQ